MASSLKLITVVGATGNQGGSVCQTFLSSPHWRVRAITRNPSSETALALAAQGAEVVVGDLNDVTSLVAAFSGSHAIFLNTDYWTTWYPQIARLKAGGASDLSDASLLAYNTETTHGINAITAATQTTTLERMVVSSLPSASKASGGKFPNSLHTEAKAYIVDRIFKESPGLAAKTSVIYLGAYDTNRVFKPTYDAERGLYRFVLPMRAETVLPIINPRVSTGLFVQALIEREPVGRKLLAYDSKLTIAQVVAEWSKASGQRAEFVPVTSTWMQKTLGVTREHLDAVDQLVETGYGSGVEDFIEPAQLSSPVHTVSWENHIRSIDWAKALEQ